MPERTITASLIIEEMCREKWMSEEQLLIHLAVEHVDVELSERGRNNVAKRSQIYHEAGIFMRQTTR